MRFASSELQDTIELRWHDTSFSWQKTCSKTGSQCQSRNQKHDEVSLPFLKKDFFGRKTTQEMRKKSAKTHCCNLAAI